MRTNRNAVIAAFTDRFKNEALVKTGFTKTQQKPFDVTPITRIQGHKIVRKITQKEINDSISGRLVQNTVD